MKSMKLIGLLSIMVWNRYCVLLSHDILIFSPLTPLNGFNNYGPIVNILFFRSSVL
jgi:hypothetical protein